MLAFFSLIFVGCEKKILGNKAPTVSFLTPQNNAIIDINSTFEFSVDPKDENGNTSIVEVLLDGRLRNVLDEAPWKMNVLASTMSSGPHSLTAIAYDENGATVSDKLDFTIFDERDAIVGDYEGIKISTSVDVQTNIMYHDTISITATITKAEVAKAIDIQFQPHQTYSPYSFFVENGTFIQRCCAPHPPTMSQNNGQLQIHHMPAQGPWWCDYFIDKVQ